MGTSRGVLAGPGFRQHLRRGFPQGAGYILDHVQPDAGSSGFDCCNMLLGYPASSRNLALRIPLFYPEAFDVAPEDEAKLAYWRRGLGRLGHRSISGWHPVRSRAIPQRYQISADSPIGRRLRSSRLSEGSYPQRQVQILLISDSGEKSLAESRFCVPRLLVNGRISPTKRADQFLLNGRCSPTKRAARHSGRSISGLPACVSYQTGEHGNCPARRLLPNGRPPPTPTCIPLGVGGSAFIHDEARQ
jgi:hypothetical protein